MTARPNPSVPRSLPGKSHRMRILSGVLVSAVCLAVIMIKVDASELQRELSRFNWWYLAAGIGSLCLGYVVRIARWSMLLSAGGAVVSFVQCVAPFLASIALNNVLPLRAGDVLRALVFPRAIGVSRTNATASLLVERFLDLAILVCCVTGGMALVNQLPWPDWLRSALSVAILGCVVIVCLAIAARALPNFASTAHGRRMGRESRFAMIGNVARSLLERIGAMSSPRVLAGAVGVSTFVWIGEAGLFLALLRGVGLDANAYGAVLVMAIATLATLVPSSPGYVGPFHLAAYMATTLLGGTPAQAASLAILSHLGLWLPTTFAGGVALLLRPDLIVATRSSASQAG